MSSLVPFWYIVIAILWTGFFILEGFDFGVGMLHSLIGRDEAGRPAAINTIGPLWDGNEVWLIDLYPDVMVSSTSPAYNLTVHNTASGGHSLKVMTVVVAILPPVVLAYQTWTYYVFRRRVSRQEFQPPVPSPGATPEPAPRPTAP